MRFLRLLPALPLLAGLTTGGVVASVGPSAVGCASAASAHHATLVIEHGNGTTLKYCIGFDTDQVTGQFLLDASGVEKGEQGSGSMGEAVCQIDYEPQQYPSGCWTASSPYWAMYVSRGSGGWSQSNLGVSSQTFHDGDAEGFRYESQSASLTPPSPTGVCPVPTPPPTAVATPKGTVRPTTTPQPRRSAAVTATPAVATSAASALATTPTPAASALVVPPLNTSSTPDVVVVAGSSAAPPTSSFSPGAGMLAASALAVALVALLIVQGVRQRGRRRAPSSGQ